MSNVLDPMTTNLAVSGKTLTVEATLEFDMGIHGNSDRTPLINLGMAALPFNQALPFALDVEDATVDKNLWEAPSADLRARAIAIYCDYGGGAIKINPDGDPLPFPLAAGGFFLYVNKNEGPTVNVGITPTATRRGIDKVTVSTENESRFRGYVFV